MFAWNAYEVLGVDLSFICHHLNVNLSITPRKQPPWRSSKDHFDAVKDEVMKLKQTGLLKKCSTLNGWPILWLWRRKMENGGHVWTSQI